MNTIVHVAGMIAAVWLAYVCFVSIGGDRVQAESETVASVPVGEPGICVTSTGAFSDVGMIRVDGDYYDYSGKAACGSGMGLQLADVTTRSYDQGEVVSEVTAPVLRQARYLGWLFMLLALLLVPATIIAMRQDYLYPAGEDA